MIHSLRIAVALPALLAIAACTGSGVDPSSLQPLTSGGQRTADDRLFPPAVAGEQPAGAAFENGSGASTSAASVAAINTNARVQFAPAVGVSAEAVPTLAARLRTRAGQRGITVAPTSDPATTHVMKGYFSAFTEGGETTVIYVWDVLDAAGSRLHRIQGQQKQPDSDGEGWAAVTAPTMEAIADRTIDELAVWLTSAAG